MAFKIYTRGGDAGETSLYGGERRAKDDDRIEAYGTVDELNAALGLLLSEGNPAADSSHEAVAYERTLGAVQSDLFTIGSWLACPPSHPSRPPGLPETAVASLETAIDELDEGLEPLRNFILPGGSRPAALAHVARTVARRAERRIVALAPEDAEDLRSVAYLNRLSDYLFVLARALNRQAGVADVPWTSQRTKPQP